MKRLILIFTAATMIIFSCTPEDVREDKGLVVGAEPANCSGGCIIGEVDGSEFNITCDTNDLLQYAEDKMPSSGWTFTGDTIAIFSDAGRYYLTIVGFKDDSTARVDVELALDNDDIWWCPLKPSSDCVGPKCTTAGQNGTKCKNLKPCSCETLQANKCGESTGVAGDCPID